MECLVSEDAEYVGSGQYTKRTIFSSRVIKMKPQSQHLVQRACRSMRIDYISLH